MLVMQRMRCFPLRMLYTNNNKKHVERNRTSSLCYTCVKSRAEMAFNLNRKKTTFNIHPTSGTPTTYLGNFHFIQSRHVTLSRPPVFPPGGGRSDTFRVSLKKSYLPAAAQTTGQKRWRTKAYFAYAAQNSASCAERPPGKKRKLVSL